MLSLVFQQGLEQIPGGAIKNVIGADTRPMPYNIFGTPGTGRKMRTVTSLLIHHRTVPPI
jgi:hypothetical protein